MRGSSHDADGVLAEQSFPTVEHPERGRCQVLQRVAEVQADWPMEVGQMTASKSGLILADHPMYFMILYGCCGPSVFVFEKKERVRVSCRNLLQIDGSVSTSCWSRVGSCGESSTPEALHERRSVEPTPNHDYRAAKVNVCVEYCRVSISIYRYL